MQSNSGNRIVWAVQLLLRVLLLCGVFQTVPLIAQCTLSCPTGLNLSIAGPSFGCESTISPIDIGVNAPSCSGLIDLDLYSSTNLLIPGDTLASGARVGVINANHIGVQLRARVTHRLSGNNCDINLAIIDGLDPDLMLSDTTVSVLQNLVPQGFGGHFSGPSIEDCSSTVANYTDSIAQNGCSNSAYAKTYRRWTVTDAFSNSSETTQVISRIAIALDSIQAPPDTSISCENGVPMGQEMGLPEVRFSGITYTLPSMSGSEANLFWSFTDESFVGGGGTAQVLRSFRFYDACSPAISGQNPKTLVQRISVIDTIAPVFSSVVDTLFYSTTTTDCQASISLPALSVSDNCTDYPSVRVQLNNQFINSNGGFFGNLPLGIYNAIYTATDSSNNSRLKTLVVVVRDQISPVLITRSALQVSLSTSGTVSIIPAAFDQGSYDDCTTISWSIRNYTDSVWYPSIEITCTSLNNPINVDVRGCDSYGNCNSRSAVVNVFDFLPPTIFSPPNLTLDCSVSDTTYSTFGQVFVSDNCEFKLEDSITILRDQCGVGYLQRFWTARDSSGNSSSASQRVNFVASHTFSAFDIAWPKDTTLSICAELNPPQLPVGYGIPSWNSVACSDIAVSHLDQLVDGPFGVCRVLLRTWTVIDQCSFDGNSTGVWTHEQQIYLIDSDAPVLSSTTDTLVVVIEQDSCAGGFLPVGLFSLADCSELDSELRLLSGGQVIDRNEFVDSSLYVSDSIDLVELFSIDKCGNKDSISISIVFLDTSIPIARCVDTLIYNLQVDSTLFGPELIDLGSSDFCGEVPFSLETTFSPSCADLGWNKVKLSVTDSVGLQGACFTDVLVIDTVQLCPKISTVVYGKIETNNNFPIPTRFDLISIVGDTISTYFSDADGEFSFDVNLLDSVTIVPSSNYSPALFVSTYDLYLIGQHILGVSEFSDPLKLIAGDANQSRSISAFDMTLLRRLFIGLSESLPHGRSVRYIPDTADLTLPDLALTPGIPIFEATLDSTNLNWHTIKLGDVSGTRSIQTSALESRSQNLLSLRWREVEAETWVLEYSGTDELNLHGFGIWVDKRSVIVDESLREGMIRAQSEIGVVLSWLSDSSPLALKHGSRLLNVKSSSRPSLDLGKSDVVVSAKFDVNIEERKMSVHYSELPSSEENPLNVYPNPAKPGTFLRVRAEALTISSLRLVDARGVIIELSVDRGLAVGSFIPNTLTPGVYALQGHYSDGRTFEQRILVSN